MSSSIFSGTIPALMTPCTTDRQPDFDALVQTGRDLVEAGMSALVYCGSMGDWPLLSDEQRMEGVERLVRNQLWEGRSQEQFYDAVQWLYGWNIETCLKR